jgi:hypothetical protein
VTRRIRVTIDSVSASGELQESAAPRTSQRVWDALPVDTTLRHVRWSGEAGYILLPTLADPGGLLENPVSFYPLASLVFRPEHGEIAFAYGQAQARLHTQPAGYATHLATLDVNASAFLAKVAATSHQGETPIRIEQESGT